MKTFMYKEKDQYIQKRCKAKEGFQENYEELVADIQNNRYVPNDFILLFQRMNQSPILDCSKVYDYLMYHALDIVAASEYVTRYLDLYRFSKSQTTISSGEMDQRLYYATHNTFGTEDSRKTFQEYSSAVPNTQVLSIIGYLDSKRRVEKPIQKQYK